MPTQLKYCALSVFLGLIFWQNSIAQSASSIEASFQHLLQDEQLRHGIASLNLVNAETGSEIYAYNSTVGLLPASTLKNVTAATAYYQLGSNFKFQTDLGYTGRIENDTLYGDLVIRGSGDPSLGSSRWPSTRAEVILEQWAAAIKGAGIRYVTGRIIGDAALFDSQMVPNGWIWEDLGNYYGAGVSGLNWRENQYDLFLNPGIREGDPVTLVRTNPKLANFTFTNELQTGSANSGDQVYIYAAPYGTLAHVRGTAPAGKTNFKVSGSIPNPPLFAAEELQTYLLNAGIKTAQPPASSLQLNPNASASDENLKVLTAHFSPELKVLNTAFLQKSINLFGESLLKTLAVHQNKEANTENGAEVLQAFWESYGIAPDALSNTDGSGLAATNRVTSEALTQILYCVKQEPWFSDFYENLPIINNIKMKSGFIGGVLAYSGYLQKSNGELLAFSIIINNYKGDTAVLRKKIFNFLDGIP